MLRPGERLLLGTSMVIDVPTMVAAYDDAQGVTAAFNRNVLRVLNRELSADFAVDAFDHHALWDTRHEWIEMRLRARRAMTVRVADLDLTVQLRRGGGAHHRDLGEVPARRGAGVAGGHRLRDHPHLDRSPGPPRADPGHRRVEAHAAAGTRSRKPSTLVISPSSSRVTTSNPTTGASPARPGRAPR